MNQSSFIAGALLAGFVLYVAAKGRLTTYSAVLWGPTSAALPPFLGIPLLQVGGTPAADAAKPGASDPAKLPFGDPAGILGAGVDALTGGALDALGGPEIAGLLGAL